MSSGWPEPRIGDVGTIVTGSTPSSKTLGNWGDGAAFLTPSDMPDVAYVVHTERRLSAQRTSDLASRLLPSGAVAVSCIASIGKVARITEPTVTNQQVNSLIPDRSVIDANFAFYWLRTLVPQLHQIASGSVAKIVNKTDFSNLTLPLPDMTEQRRIAGVLGALDDLIEVNRKLMADAAALLSGLFARLMATSVLTDMPFFEAFDVDFGGAFKGEKFSSNGVGMPLLRIRDLKTQKSDTWTTERISGDVVITAGDVLIGMDAEFRPTYWLGPDSLLNQRVCRIRPKAGSLAFAREALVKPMAFIEGHKTGTTVSHLNKADLAETRIAMPDRQSLSEFDAAADPLRLMIVGLHRENLDLAAARDELLPLLMSGRLRVGDVAA